MFAFIHRHHAVDTILGEMAVSLLFSVIKDIASHIASAGAKPTGTQSQGKAEESVVRSMEAGDWGRADQLCAELIRSFPDEKKFVELQLAVHNAIAHQRLPGPNYMDWLPWFHALLKPATYVEIGVESGRSLQFAMPPTRAIGVDPGMEVVHSQEAWVKLFKLTSDDFFARYSLPSVLQTDIVDLAFIDGLHTFDQALKDFINIERFSAPNSVVLFHDVLPVVPVTANRERTTMLWVGDTWKAILMLLQRRPELKIFTIPTYPSGLAVVTNLDSDSNVLSRDFERICQDAMGHNLDDYLPTLERHLNILATNDFETVERVLDAHRK